MVLSPEIRQYYAQRKALIKYETIEFNHPSFTSPFRLVVNQLTNKQFTVNGNLETFQAVAGAVPDQPDEVGGNSTATVVFGRIGTEIFRAVEDIDPLQSLTPITATIRIYLEGTTNPIGVYTLVVSEEGIVADEQNVEVNLTTTNPLRLTQNLFYNPSIFTGLQRL